MILEELTCLPTDWKTANLASLLLDGPKNGYSGRTGHGTDGTLTLRLSATTPGRLILNEDTTKRLNEVIHPSSDLFLRPGDVLVQRSNTIDLVGTTVVFDGPPDVYVYPDLLIRLRFRETTTAHWFWQYANSYRGRQYFRSVAAGSTGSMPKLSGERLRQMPIPLPPLREQRSIAAALLDADELIGALDKLIAKKRGVKLAAMQQLLSGKTRLPGFREQWRVARIDEHASIRTGGRNTQDRVGDGRYPFFVRSQQVERINSYSYDGEAVLTAGDGVGTGKVFHYVNGRFDVHQRVYRISDFSADLDGRYFFFQFSTRFYDRIMSMTAKSSVDSVRMEMIAGMEIPLPSRREQESIAVVLSDMESEITGLEQRREKTKAVKQGMMQSLLTGRVRLATSENSA